MIAQGYIAFEGRYPDKYDLDAVSPEHPVMLINQGGHMGAVNSYALKLAGVTAATPNPRFGLIVRDEQGEPTGALVNHAAMDVFRRLWTEQVLTQDIVERATIAPQAKFAAVGVTSFGDVNARGVNKVRAYFDVARRGEMTIRGYILNTIEYYQELAGRAEEIEALRLKEAVSTLHAAGYQCAFHVVGDAAVDLALDAIEYAMNRAPRPAPRHRLEHAVLNTDAALERTRDLGVVVSTTSKAHSNPASWPIWSSGRKTRTRSNQKTWCRPPLI